jgi:hypothetical protein
MDADLELRILRHLGQRADRPDRVHETLGAAPDEVGTALASLQSNGWLSVASAAWYGNAERAIDVVSLTPTGRAELTRRDAPPESDVTEPIEVSREDLLAELEGRGFPRGPMQEDPTLRAERFYFWPSIGAYSMILDD